VRAQMTVLDVGAGAAAHLCAGGADWLFDTGSSRDYEKVLRGALHSRGVNRLDGLVLSHGDSLHIGGAPSVLECVAREDAARQVDEAISTAQREAVPEGNEEDWCAISTRDLVDPVE
jgi:competence protein ComEC